MRFFANRKVIAAFALVLSVLLVALSLAFASFDRDKLIPRDTLAESLRAAAHEQPSQGVSTETLQFANEAIKEDVLWLARVIYSETKRPHEQELVAWVVRNRVETRYRGASTYREVVLDPWQFSAFNRNSPKRRHYINLAVDARAPGFQTALAIANDVVSAPPYERPFALTTRHFYSERSMIGRRAPAWAAGHRPVSLDRDVDPKRFRFYANIL